MMVDAGADFDLLVLGQFDEEKPCESLRHPKGADGCRTQATATHLAVRPCGCPDFLICEGRAMNLLVFPNSQYNCRWCRAPYRGAEIRVVPLD